MVVRSLDKVETLETWHAFKDRGSFRFLPARSQVGSGQQGCSGEGGLLRRTSTFSSLWHDLFHVCTRKLEEDSRLCRAQGLPLK